MNYNFEEELKSSHLKTESGQAQTNHEMIPRILRPELSKPRTNLVTQSAESVLTAKSSNQKQSHQHLIRAKELTESFDQTYQGFVDQYKASITSSEVAWILESKVNQLPVSESRMTEEVRALIQFFYRHFQVLPSQRELKKWFTSRYSLEANFAAFNSSTMKQRVKNLFSNLKARFMEVERRLCKLEIPGKELLPRHFELRSFQRVLVVNSKIEPYLKQVVRADEDRFALLMYSNDRIEKIKREGFSHVFVDGTKRCLPYDQNYQLLLVNFLLNNGQTTTGVSTLVRGSNQLIYEVVLGAVNQLISLKGKDIHTDFEMALMNSASKFTTKLSLCYFHYARNLQDRVRDLHRKFKQKISKRLYEYGKILMFVPPEYTKFHCKYMKSMTKRCKNSKRFFNYLCKNYIEGRFSPHLYQKHSKFLTNNIAESVNGQLSSFFAKKPGKLEWVDFLLFNEKRTVFNQNSLATKGAKEQLDRFDKLILKLQSRKFSYRSYKRFLSSNENVIQMKSNGREDTRYFRR